MNYGVKIEYIDRISHIINTSGLEEAQKYLNEIYYSMTSPDTNKVFLLKNKKGEVIYVCNTKYVVHSMIVSIEEKDEK